MPRALVLGNGKLTVTLDEFGFVRDVYFPYVGLENHVAGHRHRIGVWVNDQFSWLDDGTWQITLGYKPETMVGYLVCKHARLQISLVMEDIVYNETNVFLRQVDVYNHSDQHLDIRIFFHQVFLIQENRKRNTAFYDPTHNAIIHYRGRRVFLINGQTESGGSIDDFSVGTYNFEGKEGTFKDAEDGQLDKNGVDHGSVDSVIRLSTTCEGKLKTRIYYWFAVAKTLDEVYTLNQMVATKSPEAMTHSTQEYWRAWLNKRDLHTEILTPGQKKLFDTSLFVLRSHVDNDGGIIASLDSAMIEYGKDDYAYVWPRDAAYIASVMDQAGFTEVTRPFFRFCADVLHPDGYLHHRYNPDRSLGSTWHSTLAQKEWLKDRILQLPIQEDETAGTLYSLWIHYLASTDLEFIEELYKPFIEKSANFLMNFRNQTTGLPIPSYDLWEEKLGISTYTCAAVYGGLLAAAKFSELLGKRNHMREYRETAKLLKQATIKYLYDADLRSFIRLARIEDGQIVTEKTIDVSSWFGLWYFKMFEVSDPLLQNTYQAVKTYLSNPTPVGGLTRYQHDRYFADTTFSNPWLITTLWDAQAQLRASQVTSQTLEAVKQILDWVIKWQTNSGVLSEQLHPLTGEPRSATPLAWSHAVYAETVLQYLQALQKLGKLTPTPSATSLYEL